MVVRFVSWEEKSRLLVCLEGLGVLGPLVTSLRGWSGTCIVWRASMVAEGGVFSPSSGRGGGRAVGRSVGVSFKGSRDAGVGVTDRSKGDISSILSFRAKDPKSVEAGLSGDRSGERLSM